MNINNRVIFTGTNYYYAWDYKDMVKVYNLMDVFFLGTTGEGFGIPIIEAMACEVPCLVTDYTTTPELITENLAGEAIKITDEWFGTWHVNRAIMSIDDAAEKIINLYLNPKLREEYGKNGRAVVLREYEWKIVADKWDKLLKNLIQWKN